MKSLCIYNFNPEINFLLKNRKLFKKYDLLYLCIQEKWSLFPFEDTGYTIIYQALFEENLKNIDSIFFSYSSIYKDSIDDIKEKIKLADRNNKEIILSEELFHIFKNDEDLKGFSYNIISSATRFDYLINNIDMEKGILAIETPIIMIYETGPKCETSDIAINLHSFMSSRGYNVRVLGNSFYEYFFDIDLLPKWISDTKLSYMDIIFGFNKYIKEIERERNIDALIIEIPGSIMAFDDRFHNNFGVIPYLLSNAVKPDIGILSLYSNFCDAEAFKELTELLKHKFYVESAYFSLSEYKLNYTSTSLKEPQFVLNKRENIYEELSKFTDEINIFSTYEPVSMEKSFSEIVCELSENIEIV